jgi:hypothetical protein
VLQEWESLAGVFGLAHLTHLRLSKAAHLFLGELPLSDAALAAATALTNLQASARGGGGGAGARRRRLPGRQLCAGLRAWGAGAGEGWGGWLMG